MAFLYSFMIVVGGLGPVLAANMVQTLLAARDVYVLKSLIFWLPFAVSVLVPFLAYRRLRGEPFAGFAKFLLCTVYLILFILFLGASGFLWRLPGSPVYARKAQAKWTLRSLWGAERQFFRDNHRYSLSFGELGYSDFGSERLFAVGFPFACLAKAGVPEDQGYVPLTDPTYAGKRAGEIEEFFRNIRKPEACIDPAVGFEAFAVGIIMKDGPLDIWRLDEKGWTPENTENGRGHLRWWEAP